VCEAVPWLCRNSRASGTSSKLSSSPIATLCVLWPDDNWQFEAIPNQVIAAYIEREDEVDVPLYAIYRDLALHMENSYSSNERRHLRPLRWAFRVAVIALVAEVAIWLIELATRG
jgi:hypothetical protein